MIFLQYYMISIYLNTFINIHTKKSYTKKKVYICVSTYNYMFIFMYECVCVYVWVQYGFRGIGAPHIKVMYELSAPDPAKCAPGLAKCAPSHKWSVPRCTWVFLSYCILELDEKDYRFQFCQYFSHMNFFYKTYIIST